MLDTFEPTEQFYKHKKKYNQYYMFPDVTEQEIDNATYILAQKSA